MSEGSDETQSEAVDSVESGTPESSTSRDIVLPDEQQVTAIRKPIAFDPSPRHAEVQAAFDEWQASLPEGLTVPAWVYYGDLDKEPPTPAVTPETFDSDPTLQACYAAVENGEDLRTLPDDLQEAFYTQLELVNEANVRAEMFRTAQAIRAVRAIDEHRAGPEEYHRLRAMEDSARGITTHNYVTMYSNARALALANRRRSGLLLPDPMPLYLPGAQRRGPKSLPPREWMEDTSQRLAASCKLRDIANPFALDGEATAEFTGYSAKHHARSLHNALYDRGYRLADLHAEAWKALGCPPLKPNSWK